MMMGSGSWMRLRGEVLQLTTSGVDHSHRFCDVCNRSGLPLRAAMLRQCGEGLRIARKRNHQTLFSVFEIGRGSGPIYLARLSRMTRFGLDLFQPELHVHLTVH